MTRIRSALALLLAATLLLPGGGHVATGGCVPGSHAVTAATSLVQAESAAPHEPADCAAHHSGNGSAPGGRQHCSDASACAAGAALLTSSLPPRERPADVTPPARFVSILSGRVAPPVTPPPRH